MMPRWPRRACQRSATEPDELEAVLAEGGLGRDPEMMNKPWSLLAVREWLPLEMVKPRHVMGDARTPLSNRAVKEIRFVLEPGTKYTPVRVTSDP